LVITSITTTEARKSWMEGSPIAYTQAVLLAIFVIVFGIAIVIRITMNL